VKRLRTFQNWTRLCLALAGVSFSVISAAGQGVGLPESLPSEIGRKLSDRLPEKPSLPPAFSVPVGPLGYSAPGLFYLGRHNRLASLDFIGEDRLLFTFQVPGLMQREDDDRRQGDDERQIRAVVVTLPDGKVQSEALWTLHDRARYLWMLKDGHFLLRDEDGIQEGDATFQLKPYLKFPGRLLWLELDPAQQLMKINVLVPPARTGDAKSDSPAAARVGLPEAGKKPDPTPDPNSSPPKLKPDLIVRTLNPGSGEVLNETRMGLAVPQPTSSDGYVAVEEGMFSGLLERAQMPINSEGNIESLGEKTNNWPLDFVSFGGKDNFLGRVNSACRPSSEFISEREFLMTACDLFGGSDVVAMSSAGERIWGIRLSNHEIWPQLVPSLDGLRMVRETVFIEHPVGEHPRLVDPKNLKGQIVRIFDAAKGKMALETTASPILDGGGNVAISPSGRRVAILNNGEIQIFELPAPAAFRGHKP